MGNKSLLGAYLNTFLPFYRDKFAKNHPISEESIELTTPTRFFSTLNDIKLIGYLTKIHNTCKCTESKHKEREEKIKYEFMKELESIDIEMENCDDDTYELLKKKKENLYLNYNRDLKLHKENFPHRDSEMARISRGLITKIIIKLASSMGYNKNDYENSQAFKSGYNTPIIHHPNKSYPETELDKDISFDFMPQEMRKIYKNPDGCENENLTFDNYTLTERDIEVNDFDFVMDGIHFTEEWQQFILNSLPKNLRESYLKEVEKYKKQTPTL